MNAAPESAVTEGSVAVEAVRPIVVHDDCRVYEVDCLVKPRWVAVDHDPGSGDLRAAIDATAADDPQAGRFTPTAVTFPGTAGWAMVVDHGRYTVHAAMWRGPDNPAS